MRYFKYENNQIEEVEGHPFWMQLLTTKEEHHTFWTTPESPRDYDQFRLMVFCPADQAQQIAAQCGVHIITRMIHEKEATNAN